jgi:hypothetical protein
MLSLDPAKRPSAEECLRHAYFTNPSGGAPMSTQEFEALTQGMPSCHEYSIKQRERKRGRRDDDAAGMSFESTFSACPLLES